MSATDAQLLAEERNLCDALVAVILDREPPKHALRRYADGLDANERRDVFRKAGKLGIDLRKRGERPPRR